MARIKEIINEDSTLVKFESLQLGEVFIFKDYPCIFVNGAIDNDGRVIKVAVCLADGKCYHLADDELVTYVKKAELKLTI